MNSFTLSRRSKIKKGGVENAVVTKIAAATTIDLSAAGAAGRNLGFGGRKLPAWKLAAMSKI
jgi:hypothetical protein